MLAQIVIGPNAWSVGQLAIAVVVIAAIIALVLIALRQFGIAIPAWVVQVIWVIVVAFVAILAIRIVMSM